MKVFGFAGYSGSGKTTLIEQLIPRFVLRGLRVSLVKHAHTTCSTSTSLARTRTAIARRGLRSADHF